MGRDKFIWCRDCDAVHHVTPFDKAPTYDLAGNIVENCIDDWGLFMVRHESHRLEPLRLIGDRYFPNGSSWDPMEAAFLEVGNDRERLLLRQSRSSIHEPLRFHPVAGRIVERGVTLAVQENAIKKEMKFHFDFSVQRLGDDKIDLFVALFKEMIKELKPEEIELSLGSSVDDNVSFGVLDPRTVEKLTAKCAAYFPPEELGDIGRFIDRHIEGCDVMAVLIRRQIAVEQPAP